MMAFLPLGRHAIPLAIPIFPPRKPLIPSRHDLKATWLSRFYNSDSGAVTAEFILILPVFMMLFALMVSFSLMLELASEVNQVAFDLTRGSLRYYSVDIAPQTFCTKAKAELEPSILQSETFANPNKFTHISCKLVPTTGQISFRVTYDNSTSLGAEIAGFLGLNLTEISRSSTMWI